MRSLLGLIVFASACTTATPSSPSYDSVRDRMQDGARLYIGTDGSSGTITAQRYTQTGWVGGDTPLTITSGEMLAKVDSHGKLALDRFEVAVAPIDIPQEVFGKPAQLQNVKVKLASTVAGDTQWSGNDSATANLTLMLDLEWALAINGGSTPLGTQHLPAIPVTLTLSGTGDVVDASIGLAATGDLWSWAGLIKLTALDMALSAETVD